MKNQTILLGFISKGRDVEIDLQVLKICFCAISGQDRNFALERYGTDSRCFDHTEQMWEERSCEQVMFILYQIRKGIICNKI